MDVSRNLGRLLPVLGKRIAVCSAFAGVTVFAFNRVPNTTLQMPAAPPTLGYTVADAFPGLTFTNPVCIVSPPGETNRLFILEFGRKYPDGHTFATIQVITNLANPTATLFLTLPNPVMIGCEGGLLGMAFHPGYLTNRYFFVYYTLYATTTNLDGSVLGPDMHDRVSRFEISPTNPNQALPNTEVPFITQYDRACNHNAGDIHFGPDGYLYVALGDEGGGDGQFGNAQKIDLNFFSGILRIDVDKRPGSLPPNPHASATANYTIPPDNPFVGATTFNGNPLPDPDKVRTEFWAVGLRNPFRFSFDDETGQLYCGDVGQGTWEEVDLIVKGGNYGWNYREGLLPFTPPAGTPPLPPGAVFRDPILTYKHSPNDALHGQCIIGGQVYRGTRISQLYGDYVFGDYVNGNIWALHYDGAVATNFRRLTTASGPVAFGADPSTGDILIAELPSGKIRRLIYDGNPTGTPLPPTLADTGAFSDLTALTPEPGIVPYDINVPFWSDHARKSRWFSVPDVSKFIGFNATGNWQFPAGTVWIKHFDLEMTNGVPSSSRRLETRFLVRNSNGVYGATYRWGTSVNNATLVPEAGMDETFAIHDGGTIRTQVWHYPSRAECLQCHSGVAGYSLGVNTPQMNRLFDHGTGPANQIAELSQAGYFQTPVSDTSSLLALASATNTAYTVEHRVRSYLTANCVQCHQPGGASQGNWDARFTTPLTSAEIVNGLLINNLGNPNNRVIKPNSPAQSVMLTRISTLDELRMPPLASSELDAQAIALLSGWITNSLAGNNNPPTISGIGNQTIGPNGVSGPLAFTVGDVETPVANLTLTSGSSNSALIPTNNVVFGGAGANRTVTLTPLANQTGTATITVSVSDGTASTSVGFVLTVNSGINQPPVANDQTVTAVEDTPRTIVLTGSDAEGSPLTYRLVTDSRKALLAGTPPNINYIPDPGATGADSFTFVVNDGVQDSSPGTVTVNLLADTDGDGMPDVWESANGLRFDDPTDAAGDLDGDGLTNLQEYLAGTDPRDAASNLRITAVSLDSGSISLEFTTVLGKRYRVERNGGLLSGTWTVVRDNLPGTGNPVEVIDSASGGTGAHLYRVGILP